MSLQTPLARVRGLGSAKSGTHHWIAQRVTAIALVPLSIWFILSLVFMPDMSHATATEWVKIPLVATTLLLLIFCLFYHTLLGMQVVFEDYIDCHVRRTVVLVALRLLIFFAAFTAVVAILKIYLG